MQTRRDIIHKFGLANCLAAVLLCLLVAACGTLASSAPLHEHVHHDAGHEDHQCVITLFAHSAVFAATPAPMVVVPEPTFRDISRPIPDFWFPSLSHLQPQGRGPPPLLP